MRGPYSIPFSWELELSAEQLWLQYLVGITGKDPSTYLGKRSLNTKSILIKLKRLIVVQ
uniref:Uncharacterized protein n=1 Tax=Nelumbo nucifera TaxID=4432 RepID=A0A822ZRT0_NELNU|nr:TPA_asm: hypothetical protein HUJ06_004471 [Nelumbo nucifera]